MGGPIDKEQRSYELVWRRIHQMTLTFDPHSWPWPWIFKVKFWNSCISGIDGSDSFDSWILQAVNSGMGKIKIYMSLQWRHNGRDSVSNHQPHHCLLNRLFRRRSKKTSKLRVTGLCGTGEFPAQMASNAGKFFHLMTSSCIFFTKRGDGGILDYFVDSLIYFQFPKPFLPGGLIKSGKWFGVILQHSAS